ncbi:hypothetical protein BDQ17DRAFT_1330659 [Cyathus striatus]|nr:hypothetical protein BDQ17DRAFT_1330659 [Cyathus striatus]
MIVWGARGMRRLCSEVEVAWWCEMGGGRREVLVVCKMMLGGQKYSQGEKLGRTEDGGGMEAQCDEGGGYFEVVGLTHRRRDELTWPLLDDLSELEVIVKYANIRTNLYSGIQWLLVILNTDNLEFWLMQAKCLLYSAREPTYMIVCTKSKGHLMIDSVNDVFQIQAVIWASSDVANDILLTDDENIF